MKRFLEGSTYLIIEQFLQENVPLKHLLNEETLLGSNVLTKICHQSMDNFPMISIHNFRNDGIIVAISFWQVLAEFCVNIFLTISVYYEKLTVFKNHIMKIKYLDKSDEIVFFTIWEE